MKVDELLNKLRGLNASSQSDSEMRDKIQSEIDSVVAAECPLCGSIMIQSINKPFISKEEEEEAALWSIWYVCLKITFERNMLTNKMIMQTTLLWILNKYNCGKHCRNQHKSSKDNTTNCIQYFLSFSNIITFDMKERRNDKWNSREYKSTN